ncbi:amyloid beta A4 precursor protein-binding family B member 1-interacting protein isoform X2 [Myotis lucifugus]|uniref:amyloid beta A4 precursor protein-binding family B member 1-interacting protein isoform X2 n=1 Tax=Myotis lucifugus TaxID=59463 RepID=UPI000CCC77F7|nr:amyloid beta A4 precursor protein-binding family B member 1-interacting protein isoform X2 [Myotis lucifugus]
MDESNDDIDQMFSNLLGEMDLLTQSLGVDTLPPPDPKPPRAEFNYSVGFKDLNESLNALEDQDLDALMADLVADISEAEQRTIQAQKESSQGPYHQAPPEVSHFSGAASPGYGANVVATSMSQCEDDLPPPPADPMLDLPLPPPPPEPLSQEEEEAQAKADKIKLALEKLKEAKVKKLVVKVHMNDNSTKSLMVDERQLARDVLDNLFEKTHCDCSVDWCLYEIYPELQLERFFEDHENVVEVLSDWTRDTENKVVFLKKEEKYAVFKNPQTSRDLACFIQFENVNIYYGIQCKMKYKAPTDHCFVLKHPQIQKESQYIKYLCCDDERTLNQWVTGIRIAKYGKTLYDNYQRAVAKAGLASRWTNLGTGNAATPTPPSTGLTAGTAQANGQIPQAAHSVSAVPEEAQRHVDTTKDKKPALGQPDPGTPKVHHRPKSSMPPPPPIRRSSDTSGSPVIPAKAKGTGFPAPPDDFLPPPPPPPPLEDPELPPPPPDFNDSPPDFVPPPPPSFVGDAGSLPPPPPPPPALAPESPRPPPIATKRPPIPPKRQENPGPPSAGAGGGGEQDFMSDLMKALQKKRGNLP